MIVYYMTKESYLVHVPFRCQSFDIVPKLDSVTHLTPKAQLISKH